MYTSNSVIAISDQRPRKPFSLSTLSVGNPPFTPTNQPLKDLECLFPTLQHIERTGVVPNGEWSVRFYLKRLNHVLQRFSILPLLVVCERKPSEQPMIPTILAQLFPNQLASFRPIGGCDGLLNFRHGVSVPHVRHTLPDLIPENEKAIEIFLNGLYLFRQQPTLPHTFGCCTIGPAVLNLRRFCRRERSGSPQPKF